MQERPEVMKLKNVCLRFSFRAHDIILLSGVSVIIDRLWKAGLLCINGRKYPAMPVTNISYKLRQNFLQTGMLYWVGEGRF